MSVYLSNLPIHLPIERQKQNRYNVHNQSMNNYLNVTCKIPTFLWV